MRTVEEVSIVLPPELVDVIREAVASGGYGSASEVVCDALREWKLSGARSAKRPRGSTGSP